MCFTFRKTSNKLMWSSLKVNIINKLLFLPKFNNNVNRTNILMELRTFFFQKTIYWVQRNVFKLLKILGMNVLCLNERNSINKLTNIEIITMVYFILHADTLYNRYYYFCAW